MPHRDPGNSENIEGPFSPWTPNPFRIISRAATTAVVLGAPAAIARPDIVIAAANAVQRGEIALEEMMHLLGL